MELRARISAQRGNSTQCSKQILLFLLASCQTEGRKKTLLARFLNPDRHECCGQAGDGCRLARIWDGTSNCIPIERGARFGCNFHSSWTELTESNLIPEPPLVRISAIGKALQLFRDPTHRPLRHKMDRSRTCRFPGIVSNFCFRQAFLQPCQMSKQFAPTV